MSKHPVRKYWRVGVLVILVMISLLLVFGFAPGSSGDVGVEGEGAEETVSSEYTNLQFGLELAGGTRIQAPLHGFHADGIAFDEGVSTTDLEQEIADEMNSTDSTEVRVFTGFDAEEPGQGAIEVTEPNATESEFEAALDANDIEYDSINDGVTEETRSETVDVLQDKINEAGLTGGTVREVSAAGGEHYILIEIPQERRGEVMEVLEDRGAVQIDIYYPTGETDEDGELIYETEEAVLEQDDFQNIGSAQDDEQMGPHVDVSVHGDAVDRFEEKSIDTGLAQDGGSACAYESHPNQTEPCLLTKVDGELVYSAGMSGDLAASIQSGEWSDNPVFVLQTSSLEEADALSIHLRAGATPAHLDLDSGTSMYVSPSQGENFKMFGLLIGLLAILAVTLKVHYRYRDLRVSGPMMAVALSEVTILLGLAALIGYPIDLAVIGGFIAVIGTGVDDLIIIANEVLQKSGVSSQKVFRSRFKKAFWVIGIAALTTIVAMSPLMFLSLGELQGFAIFTILGVIIGVTITRPAYGDILDYLLVEDSKR